jgi:transcriptional regulator with XRE-family HTH domain
MMLTENAARDLGKALRFLRHANNLTLRDVAKRAGMSAQYVQNIERGERINASEEAFEKLARGYEVPLPVVQDLLMKARIISALEMHGLSPEHQSFIWRGVEQRLTELGVDIRTDVARVVANMLGG